LPAGTFFIVVPGRSAECIHKGATILLTSEGKNVERSSMSQFRVVADPVPLPITKPTDIADRRLQLSVEHADDAVRILSAAGSSKLVPIVIGDVGIKCPDVQ